jgi:hypothetical protein
LASVDLDFPISLEGIRGNSEPSISGDQKQPHEKDRSENEDAAENLSHLLLLIDRDEGFK